MQPKCSPVLISQVEAEVVLKTMEAQEAKAKMQAAVEDMQAALAEVRTNVFATRRCCRRYFSPVFVGPNTRRRLYTLVGAHVGGAQR